MCGIFALLYRRPLNADDIAMGRAGTAALAHRGPDGQGEFADAARGIYLGHRRLAIVDLSEAGAQPMRDGNAVLAYNGEVYNFRDLRDELSALGDRFRSTSDTEVLLRAWTRWGPAALDRLDGMFAFVLWDGRVAHLAVDAFGEKPLYVAERDDGIVISSELAVLVRLLACTPDLPPARLAAFLALGFLPAPDTAYPGIRAFAPATRMVVEDGRITGEHRYWHPPEGAVGRGRPKPLSERDLDRLHDDLAQSLTDRLVADVPLCLFGSSGVDSTLVAALCRELGATVEVLTVTFPGGLPDESKAAADAARRLGLAHRVVAAQDSGGADRPDGFLDLFGQPNDNLSVVASVQLAAAARAAGYVAGLTGTGGDEAFFGYQKQQLFWRRRRVYGLPQAARRAAASMLPLAGESEKARIAQDLLAVPNSERYLAVKNQPAWSLLAGLPGLAEWAERTYGRGSRPIELQVPAIERDQVLPGSQLVSVDVGSMRSSVELRTPFLSRRLFETAAEFDPRAFLAFGQKSVGRRLLARYLPPESVLGGKRGFVFPGYRLVSGPLPHGTNRFISPARAAAIWDRRADGGGYERLAVRLALLAALPDWAASHAGGSPPA